MNKMFPLSSHIKLFPANYQYLPNDFDNPPKLLPSGKNCAVVISVELSLPKEYIDWLHIVSLWEKTGKVPDGFAQYIIHQTQQVLIS